MDYTLTLRTLAIGELIVLLFCGTWLHLGIKPYVNRLYYVAGWVFGWVIFAGACAIGANVAAAEQATVGLRVISAALVPSTLVVVVVTARLMRHGEKRGPRRE